MKTKVVFVGDIHGDFESLDRVLAEENPDLFISVGDVGVVSDVTPNNIHILDKWKPIGWFIKGNHDNAEFFHQLTIDQEIRGLRIAALSGTLKTKTFLKDLPNNITFREVIYLSHLKDIDILVTHQPPTGLYNNSGEPVLEELLNYLVPKIYISGHIHAYRLRFHLNTFVINLPLISKGHVVAEFDDRKLVNLEVELKKGKKVIRI